MTFSELGLHPDILKAVTEEGYSEPSPIQAQAIPAVLEGRDVLAALSSTVVFGGVKINPQMMKLRRGVDVLVATPGQRQTLMFSATFSREIRELAKSLVKNPIEISVTPRNAAAKTVKQWLVPVDKKRKSKLLIELINQHQWQQVLVFSRTKHGANRLCKELQEANIRAAAIHGNKSQGARTRALAEFKDMKVRALVATDIAARGLDIDQLPQVVNFDLPNVPEDYVRQRAQFQLKKFKFSKR